MDAAFADCSIILSVQILETSILLQLADTEYSLWTTIN